MTGAAAFDEALERLAERQPLDRPFPLAEEAYAAYQRAEELNARYDVHPDAAMLTESVSILRAALGKLPDGTRYRSPYVNQLLHALNKLNLISPTAQHMDEAVALGRLGVEIIGELAEVPRGTGRVYLELAQALLSRAERTGDVPDATEAVSFAAKSVHFATSRENAAAGMAIQGNAALVRFRRQHDPDDLALAVSCLHQVYTAQDVSPRLRGLAHLHVADAIVHGNANKALPADLYDPLAAAATHYAAAAELIDEPQPRYYASIQAVGTRAQRATEPYHLRERRPASGYWHIVQADLDELDSCIEVLRSMVKDAPAAHRSSSYHELARALRDRAFLRSDVADAFEARQAQAVAADSADPGSLWEAGMLSTLGSMDWEFWRNHGRDAKVLTAAFRAWEKADQIVSAGYLDATVTAKLTDADDWNLMRTRLVEAAVQLNAQEPDRGWSRIAMERAEGAKSALLRSMVARGTLPAPTGVSPHDLTEERRLLDALLELERAELTAGRSGALAVSSERRHALASLRQVWQKWEQLGPEAQRYVALRRGDRLSWDGIESLAAPGRALVSLWHGRDGLGAAVLRPDSADPRLISRDLMQAELTEMMNNYRLEMDRVGDGFAGETWREPLVPLLADLSEQLSGITEVVLSPHGQLHLLPWPALLQRACDRSAHDRLAVVIEPALSLFAMLTARSASESAGAQVFGDPTENLPSAADEARQVGAMLHVQPLLGAQATRGAVLDALRSAGIVHIAAHGLVSPENPLESGLVLADGLLTARDLLARRLSARLVVLSACDSGRGTLGGGDELLGLTYALLQAGVGSLVVSLWRVDDKATAALMVAFHQRRADGQPAASALRDASLSLSTAALYQHSRFWGAFMVVGLNA
jgi:CHAT domain-containing protein